MRILKSRKGQSATEYILIVGAVIAAVVVGGSVFKPQIKNAFEQLGTKISGAIGTVSSQ